MTDTLDTRILGCRSGGELFELDTAIEVIGGPNGIATLRGNEQDAGDKRRELISAVRGGKHVELSAPAITFRQRDGSPNLNYLRIKTEGLASLAASFKKMPMLVDHNKWSQSARVGTITESELVQLAHGWAGFRQTLHVVKPDAVISVLDGTLDRFSIGWRATGPVICTLHRTDVRARGACSCWPGDAVELDGVTKFAEYEFQSAEGVETSGVNTPAVKGTKIEDVRQALAAELNFSERNRPIMLHRLAAVLGLAALATVADEDVALRAFEDLKRGKLAAEQERDVARTELAAEKAKVAAAELEVIKAGKLAAGAKVDGMLEAAYREGKLLYGRDADGKAIPSLRESRLRKMADRDGVDELAAELAELPVIAPINQRQLQDDPNPRAAKHAGPVPGGVLANVAKQLGLKPEDLEAHATALAGGKE